MRCWIGNRFAYAKQFYEEAFHFIEEKFGADNDIVVALYVLPFLVFPIAEICPHTGDSKIIAPAVEGRNAVVLPRYKPPGFIKDGLYGKLVMLEQQILFGCPVVCIFRAEMFEYRQPLHLLSARLHT